MKNRNLLIIVGLVVLIALIGRGSGGTQTEDVHKQKILAALKDFMSENRLDAKGSCAFKPGTIKITDVETSYESEIDRPAKGEPKYTKKGYLIGGSTLLTKDIICNDLTWKDSPDANSSPGAESCTTHYTHKVKFEIQGPAHYTAYLEKDNIRVGVACRGLPDDKEYTVLSGTASLYIDGPTVHRDHISKNSPVSRVEELYIH